MELAPQIIRARERKVSPLFWLIFLLIVASGLGYLVVVYEILAASMLVVVPIALVIIASIIRWPLFGVVLYLHLSFPILGLNRFIAEGVPYGLAIDGVLLFTILGVIFSSKREDVVRMFSPLTYVMLLWFIFTTLELLNPEVLSREAWFFAVRGVSLYCLQTVILTFILFNKRHQINQFIKIWIGWSLIAAVYGFKQKYVGLTEGEDQWLKLGAESTHILFGQLRTFSFYTDAGQFGAAMGHASVFCLIMALGPFQNRMRLLYLVAGLVTFWGLAISGTRGAMFVVIGGGLAYLILIRNFRLLMVGFTIGLLFITFLKFTRIGQSNYQINRMRTSLDPNDASLQLRLLNQQIIRGYMSTRPFGAGIGSAGYWGQRFTPGTFLANMALDSWYVKIWVETGIIGLYFHIFTLIFCLYYGFKKIFRFDKDPRLRQQLIGLYCGFSGICLASYGNQILGQLPTGTIMYMSMAFFFLVDSYSKDIDEENNKKHAELAKGLDNNSELQRDSSDHGTAQLPEAV